MRRKLLWVGLVAGLFAVPAAADTAYRWVFNVQEEDSKAPVEGLQINFKLEDGRSGARSDLQCTTDAAGQCALEGTVVGGGIFSYSRANGTFTVSKAGYMPEFKTSGKQISETTREMVVLVQPAPRPRAYAVVDQDDKPVEGARIMYEEGRVATEACSTDTAGKCNFIAKKPRTGATVVLKPGYYSALAVYSDDAQSTKTTVIQRRHDAALQQAAASATLLCSTKETCDRIYSTAQIYLTRQSDMKVQFSNDTITETHNAVEISQIAGRVTRAPSGKQGWEVGLELNCGKSLDPRMLVALPTAHKAERECAERRLVAYRGFAAWVTQRAQ